jgi:outer membrane assembly lipoprotein YfiO
MTCSPWSRGAWICVLATALLLVGCGSTGDDLSGKTAEKLYADAKEDMDSGSYERAIKALERVEGLAAGSLLAQQSQLDLAYLYWKTGEKAQALTTIERFIKLNPSSAALDYALYLRGMINFNEDLGFLGNWAGQDLSERDQRAARDAFQAFRQLVDQFPTSKYSEDARFRMDYIVNSLAAPRRLPRGCQPGAADGDGVPGLAVGRGGAVHHDAQLRQARARAIARRLRARAAPELPEQRLPEPGHRGALAPGLVAAVLI